MSIPSADCVSNSPEIEIFLNGEMRILIGDLGAWFGGVFVCGAVRFWAFLEVRGPHFVTLDWPALVITWLLLEVLRRVEPV